MHESARSILCCRFNTKIGTDGGSRGKRESSTGWGVYAVQVGEGDTEGKHRLIMKGGTYYAYGHTSLV